MMKRLLSLYPTIAPAILTPLGCWLWWRHYGGDARLALLALGTPILFAYIVPGIGTNLLKVWEFDARLKLGRFRPQHGFVFGSATAILMLPVMGAPQPAAGLADVLLAGFIAACVLGFVNWIYDIAAIRAGILKVYNQPHADGLGPEAIAADYAPWFFGGFGLCYGAGLRFSEGLLIGTPGWLPAALLLLGMTAASVVLPTLAYAGSSWRKHGHSGCRPVHPHGPEEPA